jgi:hypothetical protein
MRIRKCPIRTIDTGTPEPRFDRADACSRLQQLLRRADRGFDCFDLWTSHGGATGSSTGGVW